MECLRRVWVVYIRAWGLFSAFVLRQSRGLALSGTQLVGEPPTHSARHMPLLDQLEQKSALEVRLMLKDTSREFMVYSVPDTCKCEALLIRRYASMIYLTMLRKAYRLSTSQPRTSPFHHATSCPSLFSHGCIAICLSSAWYRTSIVPLCTLVQTNLGPTPRKSPTTPSVLYINRNPIITEEVSNLTASGFRREVFGEDVEIARRCCDACICSGACEAWGTWPVLRAGVAFAFCCLAVGVVGAGAVSGGLICV